MTYYKFLLANRVTPVAKSTWPVRLGAWTPKAAPEICVFGWHASEAKDLLAHMPSANTFTLFEVEGRGAMVQGNDKVAFAQMKLVRVVREFDAKSLRLYACAVAEDVLPIFEKKYSKDQRPRQAIEVARRFALGNATREELDAAGAAAWDAAGAAGAAAGAAAGDAARYAAGDAAWYAAGAAAWYAAGDAARKKYATWLIEGWPGMEEA